MEILPSCALYSFYEIKPPRHLPGGEHTIIRRRIGILSPLFDRLKAIAECEGLTVEQLIDHALRSFEEEYEWDDDEDSSDDEDETTEDESSGGDEDQESA